MLGLKISHVSKRGPWKCQKGWSFIDIIIGNYIADQTYDEGLRTAQMYGTK